MGQVLQGFGKKKKNRHRAKETRQTTFQAEGTESAGTVLEEHGAYPKKETAHPHPAAPVHGRKRRIEPAYPGKGEDYGQLEMGAEEDQYPVTFPCVLIGNTNSDWHDLGYGAQKSESALTVRLAIDCYDDTSYASGTYDKVRERQQLAKKLYKSLQCLQCTDNASPLVREKSRSYAMPHYIKVYEMTFSFTLHDESAMPSSYGE